MLLATVVYCFHGVLVALVVAVVAVVKHTHSICIALALTVC